MYKEFYSAMESAALPVLALLFFLTAFVLVLLRTFGAHRREHYDGVAALPLADTETPVARGGAR